MHVPNIRVAGEELKDRQAGPLLERLGMLISTWPRWRSSQATVASTDVILQLQQFILLPQPFVNLSLRTIGLSYVLYLYHFKRHTHTRINSTPPLVSASLLGARFLNERPQGRLASSRASNLQYG
jgi:hypothetical protein